MKLMCTARIRLGAAMMVGAASLLREAPALRGHQARNFPNTVPVEFNG
jgi:hypothetical protein